MKVKKEPKKDEKDKRRAKYKHDWWKKKVETQRAAILETIAGEMRRIFNPHQPKIRWTKEKEKYYVLSKDVELFRTLHELKTTHKKDVGDEIREGRFKGAGHFPIIALNVTDLDCHPKNIGVDKNGNFIVIDNGECYARLNTVHIPCRDYSSADIHNPFSLSDYLPYNWLDIMGWVDDKKTRKPINNPVFNDDLLRHETVQRDRCRAILQILLLPDALIPKFIDCYLPANADDSIEQLRSDIIAESTKSKLKFKHAIQTDPEFAKYLFTDAAEEDCKAFKNQLEIFSIRKKVKLVEIYPKLSDELTENFETLKEQQVQQQAIELTHSGNFSPISQLIDDKKIHNLNVCLEYTGDWNLTPLHYAARHGNLDMVKKFLAHGAQLEAKDKQGRTPLDLAKEGHKTEVIEYLTSCVVPKVEPPKTSTESIAPDDKPAAPVPITEAVVAESEPEVSETTPLIVAGVAESRVDPSERPSAPPKRPRTSVSFFEAFQNSICMGPQKTSSSIYKASQVALIAQLGILCYAVTAAGLTAAALAVTDATTGSEYLDKTTSFIHHHLNTETLAIAASIATFLLVGSIISLLVAAREEHTEALRAIAAAAQTQVPKA
ncbi:MAG: ankyrin repeat domain-containing protein [Gammaproteobacteria bacterium]